MVVAEHPGTKIKLCVLVWYGPGMGRTDRIAELARRRRELEEQIDAVRAEHAGVLAELGALQRGTEAPSELVGVDRTTAIIAVLREAEGPLRTAEVVQRLQAHGREADTAAVVNATLVYLRSQGRVSRPARGLYTAA